MGQVPILTGPRSKEEWIPYDLRIDVAGTALQLDVLDVGPTLVVNVVLDPSGDRYKLEFERMTVVAYTVSIVDRVNHVQMPVASERGGAYIVKNSDFHKRESEWENQYTAEGTLHIAIPADNTTIELLILELPQVTRL
jgi:hypothetical protein